MRTTIEMAREAGIRDCTCNGTLGCLERLVELVRADEREACAKVCENLEAWNMDDPGSTAAKAIRARSNT